MDNSVGINGKDMPAEADADYAMPVRATETGYGASVQEIERGWLDEPMDDSDSRVGEWPMPQTPRGFLYRGMFPIDR